MGRIYQYKAITVRKIDATGSPLAGAELLLETSTGGKMWTEVGRVTTDKTGAAKWEELTLGAKYRITEVKAPAGYPDVVEVDDLRRMLGGISRRLAYRLLADQEIRSIKVGRAYKIPKVCVIEYLMGEEMCHIHLS